MKERWHFISERLCDDADIQTRNKKQDSNLRGEAKSYMCFSSSRIRDRYNAPHFASISSRVIQSIYDTLSRYPSRCTTTNQPNPLPMLNRTDFVFDSRPPVNKHGHLSITMYYFHNETHLKKKKMDALFFFPNHHHPPPPQKNEMFFFFITHVILPPSFIHLDYAKHSFPFFFPFFSSISLSFLLMSISFDPFFYEFGWFSFQFLQEGQEGPLLFLFFCFLSFFYSLTSFFYNLLVSFCFLP